MDSDRGHKRAALNTIMTLQVQYTGRKDPLLIPQE
jgi:hypothetical protein